MSELSGAGITVQVPDGWEGRIYTRARATGTARVDAASTHDAPNAVLHVASFAMPPGAGDYGSGAVEQMTNTDLLVVLMEHGRKSADTALFASDGVPRLQVDDVSTTCLQRLIDGQGGAQRFFNTAGRAFSLYVVFGSYARRVRTIPVVNAILDSLTIA